MEPARGSEMTEKWSGTEGPRQGGTGAGRDRRRGGSAGLGAGPDSACPHVPVGRVVRAGAAVLRLFQVLAHAAWTGLYQNKNNKAFVMVIMITMRTRKR